MWTGARACAKQALNRSRGPEAGSELLTKHAVQADVAPVIFPIATVGLSNGPKGQAISRGAPGITR